MVSQRRRSMSAGVVGGTMSENGTHVANAVSAALNVASSTTTSKIGSGVRPADSALAAAQKMACIASQRRWDAVRAKSAAVAGVSAARRPRDCAHAAGAVAARGGGVGGGAASGVVDVRVVFGVGEAVEDFGHRRPLRRPTAATQLP